MRATGQLGFFVLCVGHAAYDVHNVSIDSTASEQHTHTLQVGKACGTALCHAMPHGDRLRHTLAAIH